MRNFDFSPLYRSAIGFDRLFNLLENNQRQSELDITAQDNLLVVKGAHQAEETPRTYLYQGIAERNFERKFQLAENIHVKGASLINGLLYIDLERVVPEANKPRRIEIN